MKVLIVDNNDSFTHNLVQLVEQTGLCGYEIIKNDISSYDCSNFEKILFSPGPGIPSEETGLMKCLLKKYSETKSILGVCLGHQAIAQFFGAKIFNLEKPFHGIREKIKITDRNNYIFKGLPDCIDGGLYHSWCISHEDFPDSLNISAISEKGIIMAISHKIYDIKGIQFHPESIITETGSKIITNWLLR